MEKKFSVNRGIALLLTIIMSVSVLCACGSSSRSSGKKYSDLSDTGKRNAKWAYEVSKGIK